MKCYRVESYLDMRNYFGELFFLFLVKKQKLLIGIGATSQFLFGSVIIIFANLMSLPSRKNGKFGSSRVNLFPAYTPCYEWVIC